MTTVFPGSLDALSNPSSSDTLNSGTAALKHATQHSNANDCIEAIEAKLGTGVSTAAASTVLRGTGTGASAFGQAVNGDINLTWATFTPSLQQNGAVSHTVNYARQCVVGKMALVQIKITATGAGSAGQAIQVTVPAGLTAIHAGGLDPAGIAAIDDAGSATYFAMAIFTTGTTLKFRINQGSDYVGANPSFALANSDAIFVTLAYELA